MIASRVTRVVSCPVCNCGCKVTQIAGILFLRFDVPFALFLLQRSVADTSALLSRCRSHQTTITSAITAATAAACATVITAASPMQAECDPASVVISFATETRRHCAPPVQPCELGFHVSFIAAKDEDAQVRYTQCCVGTVTSASCRECANFKAIIQGFPCTTSAPS